MNHPAYWQQELMRENINLRRWIEKAGVEKVVRLSVSIERHAFVTTYIMRKLTEVGALTEEVIKSTWAVTNYPITVSVPPRAWFLISEDRKTWRQPVEQHYDLDAGREETMKFKDICNRLIHHFAFDVRLDRGGVGVEILFNSDQSTDRLWAITLDRYMGLVDEVAHDETMWIDGDMSRTANPVIRYRQRPDSW